MDVVSHCVKIVQKRSFFWSVLEHFSCSVILRNYDDCNLVKMGHCHTIFGQFLTSSSKYYSLEGLFCSKIFDWEWYYFAVISTVYQNPTIWTCRNFNFERLHIRKDLPSCRLKWLKIPFSIKSIKVV